MHLDILAIILTSVLFFFIVGRFISMFFNQNFKNIPTYSVFKCTFLGLLSVITLFAIYKTNFNSVFLGLLILAILYTVYVHYNALKLSLSFNKRELLPDSCEFKVLLVLLSICTIYFFIQSALFYNYPLNNFPPMDFLYYASVVQSLDHFGIETTKNAVSPFLYSDIASPYHYIDLWFATFFHTVFDVKSLESYVVITSTILSSLLFFGMFSLLKSTISSKYLLLIAGFAAYVTYFDFSTLLGGFASMTWAIMSNPKFMFSGLIFLWVFIEILNDRKSKSYVFILLLLPIFNILYAPTLYLTLGIIMFFIYLKTKRSADLFILAIVFITALFIFVFYSINSSGNSINISPLKLIHDNLHFSFMHKLRNIAKDVVVSYSILWIPFILLFIVRNSKAVEILKENRILFSVVILQVFFGAVIWIFLEDIYDSFQFFFLTLIGVSLLSLVSVFLVFTKLETVLLKRLLIVFISVICIYFPYNMMQTPGFYIYTANPNSSKYVDQVMNEIGKKQKFNYIGANIKSSDDRLNTRNSYGYITNYFISNYDGFYTICLNPKSRIEKHNINESITQDYDPSPFMNYVNMRVTKCENYSLETNDIDYIKENNIDYVILGRNVKLPSVLNSMVDTVFYDSKSGDKFVFLNN